MSGKEVSMRNAREILRLRVGKELTIRQVASSCKVSPSTVVEYEKRFRESGLEWPPPQDLDDVALERVLCYGQPSGPTRQMPEIGHLVKELKRPHVTMQLLWVEYRETFPDRYEPDLNPSFSEMAAHYGTAVIPARIRKPRDKAIVEVSVQIAQRWIVAALRNRTFHSLAEINEAIAELLDRINNRKFKAVDAMRQELFDSLDKPYLKPLPLTRYVYGEWKKATVNRHNYSVHYHFARKKVDVRLTAMTLEVLFNNKRIASHLRSYEVGGYTTCDEHMPESHKRYLEWTPSRIVNWAAQTGPATAELVKQVLERRPHPEQGFRSCLGIINLGKKFGATRVEAAAKRALAIRSYSYMSVKSILEKNLDSKPIAEQLELVAVPTHANIRGRDYYRN